MATVSVEISENIYTKLKTKNINAYLTNLIKEDLLLDEIKSSKLSGINSLNSLSNLDD